MQALRGRKRRPSRRKKTRRKKRRRAHPLQRAHSVDGRGDHLGHAGRRRRRHRFRLPRRNDSSGLRRIAEVSRAPYSGAPRAGCGAHGRRLRARFGRRGRGHCHQRSRLDQPGHRYRHRDARLHSHGVHHRERVIEAAGNRCVSGSRHYRHYASRHQAQLSGESRRGHCADHPPCISNCAQQSSRAGARRHYQGCRDQQRDL